MSRLTEPVGAREVLSWDEARLVSFLHSCRGQDGGDIDLSDVLADVDRLAPPERDELGLRITAALDKLPDPNLDTDELFKRLEAVRDLSEPPRRHISSRSPTRSPSPPESNVRLQSIFYHDLIDRQGRPALPLEYLSGQVTEEQQKKQQQLWVDMDYVPEGDDHVAPVFSGQLDDWREFRHKWQWDNRGKDKSGEGFSEHLEWQKKTFTDQGDGKWAAQQSFADAARLEWTLTRARAKLAVECSSKRSLSTYMEAATQRLSNHGFLKSVEFMENPREQDMWTTWVEYLEYVYFWQDSYSKALAKVESRSDEAWEAFEKHDWVSRPNQTGWDPQSSEVEPKSLEARLEQANAEMEARTAAVHELLKRTAPYRRRERLLRRQEKRAAWVLQQIALIEAETEGAANKDDKQDQQHQQEKRDDLEAAPTNGKEKDEARLRPIEEEYESEAKTACTKGKKKDEKQHESTGGADEAKAKATPTKEKNEDEARLGPIGEEDESEAKTTPTKGKEKNEEQHKPIGGADKVEANAMPTEEKDEDEAQHRPRGGVDEGEAKAAPTMEKDEDDAQCGPIGGEDEAEAKIAPTKGKEKDKAQHEPIERNKGEAKAAPTSTGKGKGKRTRSNAAAVPRHKRAKVGGQEPRSPEPNQASDQVTSPGTRRSQRLAGRDGAQSSPSQEPTPRRRIGTARQTPTKRGKST